MRIDPRTHCQPAREHRAWALAHDALVHPLLALTGYASLAVRLHNYTSQKAWPRSTPTPEPEQSDMKERQVWKLTFKPPYDKVEHHMSASAKPLHVAEQHGNLCMWYELEVKDEMLPIRKFHVVGTGHSLPYGKRLTYIGTGLLFQGSLVLHVYEEH